MFLFAILSAIVLLVTNEAKSSYIAPCGAGDNACIESTANSVYQQLMKGIPALDIEPNEPARLAIVDAEVASLKYKFTDAKISGMDKCKISTFNYNSDTMKINLHVSCPKVVIESPYESSGTLLMVLVHGRGDCLIVTGLYNFDYECSAKVSESNGTRHLSIRSCQVTVDAVGAISFDVKNLFDGNKQMSDAFHDFLHANWKEVHDIIKDPIWEVHTKNLIIAANKFLKNVPVEDLKSSKYNEELLTHSV